MSHRGQRLRQVPEPFVADVIELVDPSPRDERQSALFGYLLDRRHHDDGVADAGVLPVLAAAAGLEAVPVAERRDVLRARGPAVLSDAGFSWEHLAGWLPGGMDAEAWEMAVPSMGVGLGAQPGQLRPGWHLRSGC